MATKQTLRKLPYLDEKVQPYIYQPQKRKTTENQDLQTLSFLIFRKLYLTTLNLKNVRNRIMSRREICRSEHRKTRFVQTMCMAKTRGLRRVELISDFEASLRSLRKD